MIETRELIQGTINSMFINIPQDWKVKRLFEIVSYHKLGGNYKNAETVTDHALIKMGNINRGCISLDKVSYVMGDVNNDDLLKEGDLLFNTRNTLELVGKVAIWQNELEVAYYNSNLMRMHFHPEFVLSNHFMNYVFNSSPSIRQLSAIATGTTSVAAIYTKDLLKIKFLLPPLQEQKKIADILSTWDKSIETTQALIQQLQLRKKGLMQQLLSGKKRLPGFTEEWKTIKLSDCASNMNIKNKGQLGSDLLYGVNKKHGIIPMREETKGSSFDRCKLVNPHWFAYNPMRINIGSIAFYQGETNVMVSGDYVVFKCYENILLPEYLNIYRRSHLWNQFMLNAGNGSVRVRIYFKDLGIMKVILPSIEEQLAIASVINEATKEVENLKLYSDYLRDQKKGLMQELLTGQKRVAV